MDFCTGLRGLRFLKALPMNSEAKKASNSLAFSVFFATGSPTPFSSGPSSPVFLSQPVYLSGLHTPQSGTWVQVQEGFGFPNPITQCLMFLLSYLAFLPPLVYLFFVRVLSGAICLDLGGSNALKSTSSPEPFFSPGPYLVEFLLTLS